MKGSADSSEQSAPAKRELQQLRIAGCSNNNGDTNSNRQDQEHDALNQLEIGMAHSGVGFLALCSDKQGFLLPDEQGDLIGTTEPV
jgi:hypothetical protein